MRETKYDETEQLLLSALKLNSQIANYHFLLGKLYWKKGDHQFISQKNFFQKEMLLAAKLNPIHSSCFAYLGSYYESVEHDTEKGYYSPSLTTLNHKFTYTIIIIMHTHHHTDYHHADHHADHHQHEHHHHHHHHQFNTHPKFCLTPYYGDHSKAMLSKSTSDRWK
jgi:hypothetical protein